MSYKVAIVGLGKIARDQHLPAIGGSDRFELAAVASRNAELSDTPCYRTLEELLVAEPDIPCISLCTPPQVRYNDARLALEEGRHVMLEKPPGATLSEVYGLEKLADKAGVTLFTTWHSRRAAAVEATRSWLADKKILDVQIRWFEDVREWHPGQEWVWTPGGLGVFDPGINALSILTRVMPTDLHLEKADLYFPANRETPIAADLQFFKSDDAVVSVKFDWRADAETCWQIHFVTDQGTARLDAGGATLLIDGEVKKSGENGEYASLYARFAELVDSKQSDVDLAPMRHVADAFMLGQRHIVEPFDWS